MTQCLVADLGGTKLTAALVDTQGRILARRTERVDTSSTYAPVEQICRLSAELRQGHLRRGPGGQTRAFRLPPWKAVGVAVPGLVRRTGTVWAPNLRGWHRVPLARLLRRRLRVPVVVESDRNAAVIGEAWRGRARGKSDVIALIVGTGIGAGILSGSQLVRGAHELSGCAGWMVVSEEESHKTMRSGSLEALVAGPGIARAARRAPDSRLAGALVARPRSAITAAAVAQAARQGDRAAKQVFERAGTLLGLATANLISLFDPEVVVLGGGVAGAADLYLGTLKRVALDHCQPIAARHVRIVVSRLGNDANLLGMARLAFAAGRTGAPAKQGRRGPGTRRTLTLPGRYRR
jgi:glucokinase